MRILALTGMPGAGKSTVASLALEDGIAVITMGDAVRQELKKRGMAPTPFNFDLLTKGLREERGDAVIAKLTLSLILDQHKDNAELLVIDGVRSMPEVYEMKKWLFAKSVTVMAVLSPFKERFSRLYGRGRAGDPKQEDELRKRDEAELSVGLGSVIALADVFVVNDGVLTSFVLEAKRKLSTWQKSDTRPSELLLS